MSRSHAAASARHATNDTSHARVQRERQEAHASSTATQVAASVPVSNQALGQALGAGTGLDPTVQADMEARFGESFADVRIHDDARAHRSAAKLEAKAYTRGTDVAFSAGRYAPQAPEGKRLLAHELAHVVQQRRGGAAPELSSAAPHEAGAAQAATQVTAGSSTVAVSGATGVGIAREVDDEKKKSSLAAPTPASDGLLLGDATRMLSPGVDYWLTHSPDLAVMTPLQLRDEANQIGEWEFRQTQTTTQKLRLQQVRERLEQAAAQLPQATQPGAKPRRRHSAAKAQAPGAADPTRPRLGKRNSSTRDPALLADNYNEIVRDLSRKDLTAQERGDLQLELDSMEPLVDADLVRRSALRHADVVDRAITPEDRYYGADKPLIERMRRIDSIKPDSEQPGMHYLMHGRERIPIPDVMLKSIRANAMRGLNAISVEVHAANEEVMADYREFVDKTFEKHPVVGAISMIRSEENPLDWEDKLLPIVAASNSQVIGGFRQQRREAQDPWNAAPPSLEAMARTVDAGERVGEGARNYLEYKTGLVYEGTAGAIRHLGRMKTAGQVAANIAFSPLGGALYSASESTLEQLSEMHYGQREHFDYLAPVIDAASSYVGGKITGGLMGGLGKNAPLWLRAATFIPADRLGAAASTITHGSVDSALGRSEKGFGDIMGEAASDLTDWRQGLFNLVTVGFGHAVKTSGGKGRGAPKPMHIQEVAPATVREPVAPASAVPEPTVPKPVVTERPVVAEAPPPREAPARAATALPEPSSGRALGPQGALPKEFHEDASARMNEPTPIATGFGAGSRRKMAEGTHGVGQRELGVHIDEPLAVGDENVSPARQVQRALDPHNRQMLDSATNPETKHLGISPETIERNRNPLPPVSLATQGVAPSSILTRRFSEVTELRQVFEQAVSTIRNKSKYTAGELKEKINANFWSIVGKGKSPEGVAIRDAFRVLGFEYVPREGMKAVKSRAAGRKPPATQVVE